MYKKNIWYTTHHSTVQPQPQNPTTTTTTTTNTRFQDPTGVVWLGMADMVGVADMAGMAGMVGMCVLADEFSGGGCPLSTD